VNRSLIQQLVDPAKREQCALVISGSPRSVPGALVSLLAQQANFIVAVDSGAEVVRSAAPVPAPESDFASDSQSGFVLGPVPGPVPDLVLGDFDSIDPQTLADFRSKGVEIVTYDSHKDATDLELALDMVWQRGFTAIIATNVLGGRVDHELAALGNLAAMVERGMAVSIIEKNEFCVFLSTRSKQGEGSARGTLSTLKLDFASTPAPSFISLIPWGGEATVSIKGVKWELDRATLTPSSSRGVSNVVANRQVSINVHNGTALVLLEI
jgi:thiamine pyrophosphokinase